MLTFPNAKINIGLYITGKREDGYHNLETVFYPVKLSDALELIELPGMPASLRTSGLAVAGRTEDNLVWSAFRLLQRDFPDKVRPLQLLLHKVIPMGGGMGGGSADGAFMLRMLNEFFGLQLDTPQLESYALQLGSDCPFFIHNRPSFASGRGEVLEPVSLDLSGYSLQLICPELHVSTAGAFRNIIPRKAPLALRELPLLPLTEWRQRVGNDFERPVFEAHPVLADIKQQLYDQGAIYAAMSGTGSTLYGVFEKGREAVIKTSIPYRSFQG